MKVRERLFLISGGNFDQRQRTLSGIKKRLFKEKDSPLDTFTFYGKEVELKGLNDKLLTASFGQRRMIIFRNFHQLASPVRKFIFKNIKRILLANYVVFDSDKEYYQLQRDKRFMSDSLFTLAIKQAAVYKVSPVKKDFSFQDLMSSLRKNDLNSSLYIIESLFRSGSNAHMLGPQIIGVLVHKCSGFSNPRREICLEYLWEADRALKEKGVDSRLAIETLLVKIFTPSAG
ncbi:MAG: hypothetical protein K9L86_03590 [Candidatus Omnitrophica bacterium]|nr:hypothetical protein [Candidatus Omnitrophota bacterium]